MEVQRWPGGRIQEHGRAGVGAAQVGALEVGLMGDELCPKFGLSSEQRPHSWAH